MSTNISSELLEIINNPNSKTDKIVIVSDMTTAGNANINININEIAQKLNIDPKKLNFVFAYLGKTNNIGGALNIDINSIPKVDCPTCPIVNCPTCPKVDCPTCPIVNCPTCPKVDCPTFSTIPISIIAILCIIIIIFIIMTVMRKKCVTDE
jgi:hypothetical protein